MSTEVQRLERFYLCSRCAGLYADVPEGGRCPLCEGRVAFITRTLIEDTGYTPEELVAATEASRLERVGTEAVRPRLVPDMPNA